MAKELTGLGKFTIWVLVPILVGVVGYAYVGPHIGGIGAKAPALRNLGRELAKKVRQPAAENEGSALEPGESAANASTTNEAANGGGTEFQRIRGETPRTTDPKPTPPRERRAPLDRVD